MCAGLWRILWVCVSGWSVLVASAEAAEPIRVAAASSLADVLKAAGEDFTKATGVKVEVRLGGSNMLARQIAEGAPADVFISADNQRMDELEARGLVERGTRTVLVSNKLLVVVPSDSRLQLAAVKDLAGPAVTRWVTGDPKAVPIGVYARLALSKAGVWGSLEPRLVAVENARAALAAVESGNVDAGVVFRTDAAISKRVRVAFEVPEAETPPIVYPMAALKGATDPARVRRYLEYLQTEQTKRLFEKFGFIVPGQADGGH